MMAARFRGQDLLTEIRILGGAMWTHDKTSPEIATKVTIDPAKNDVTRGELSIKGFSNGKPMARESPGKIAKNIWHLSINKPPRPII